MKISFICMLLVFFIISTVYCKKWVRKDEQKYRPTFVKNNRADPDELHNVTIAVQQNNLDKVQEMLLDRSNPDSPLYQQWLTQEEIANMTRNDAAVESVQAWLATNNITIQSMSWNQEFIHTTAPIKTWETALNTKFYKYKDMHDPTDVKEYRRSASVSIPAKLDPHIAGLMGTCEAPPVMRGFTYLREGSRNLVSAVSVSFLNNLYGIPSNQC